jgi:hypothetical protein
MPFNGSGTFTIVNTFVPNTTILSSAVNQNFTDIATGLSDCLTRDNQAGMTAIFRAVSGSVSAPGITFNSDTTAGLFLSSTGIVGLVAKSLGLIVNSAIYCMSTVAVQAGGSGYAVGDTITLTGGTAISQAVLTVATLSGSAVATATVTYPGFYTVKPSDPVAQGSTSGSGSSATFNITWVAQFSSSIVTNEAGALSWQRHGASSFVSGIMAKANAYDYAKAIMTFGSGVSLSNSTSPPTLTATVNPTFLPNFIGGLTLSTAGSSATMSISAGSAADSTNTTLMKLSSAISKTTSSWAVGTGNGGLDTGAIATSTWYHFYEIERVDTGVVDVVFSTNATTPTLPANYTLYRRIGSGKTNGSSQWTAFQQSGNKFEWLTQVVDVAGATPASNNQNTVTLTVPTGVAVEAMIHAGIVYASGNAVQLWVWPKFLSAKPSIQLATGFTALNSQPAMASGLRITTDTSAQVFTMIAFSTSCSYSIETEGWIDWRGQNV